MEIQYSEELKEFVKQPVAFVTRSGAVYTPSGTARNECKLARTGGSNYLNPVGAVIHSGTLEGEKNPVLYVWFVQTAGLLRDFKANPKMYLGKYWYQRYDMEQEAPANPISEYRPYICVGHIIRQDKSFNDICILPDGKIYCGVPCGSEFVKTTWMPHARAKAMRLSFIADARIDLSVFKCVYWSEKRVSTKTVAEINKVFPSFSGVSMSDFSDFLLRRRKDLSTEAKKKATERKEKYAQLIRDSQESEDYRTLARICASFQGEAYYSIGLLYKYNDMLFHVTVGKDGTPYRDAEWHIFDGSKHVCVNEDGDTKVPSYPWGAIIATKETVNSSPLKVLLKSGINVFYSEDTTVCYNGDGVRVLAESFYKKYPNVILFDAHALRVLRHEKMVEQLINMGCKNLAALCLADSDFLGSSIYGKFSALTKKCGYTAKQLKIIDEFVTNANMTDWGFNPSVPHSLSEILKRLDSELGEGKRDVDPTTFEKVLRLSSESYWNIKRIVSEIESNGIGTCWFDRIRKITSYLNNDLNDSTVLSELVDYIRMRDLYHEADSTLPVLPPPSKVHEYHDDLVRRGAQLEMRLNRERAKKLNQKYEKVYDKAAKFEYEDGPYCIVCPKGLEELVYEGNVLQHCVGSYQESVANGKEYILFMRKTESKDVPWYTIDVLPDGHVRQIHTRRNGCIKDDSDKEKIMSFLHNWCEHTGAIESSLDNINGALCAVRN